LFVINFVGLKVHNDEPCNTDGEHEIELLFPFMKDTRAEASTAKNVTGILLFTGSVFSYAYLNVKEPVSQAIADIKVLQRCLVSVLPDLLKFKKFC
jgi:hypothetical protein